MLKKAGTRSGRRPSGGFVLLFVLAALIASASASVSSFASSRSTTLVAQANEPPSACVDYVSPSNPAVTLDRPFLGGPQVSVCGSFRNDQLKIKRGGGHGTQIWAGPGNDHIEDQNGAVNEVWGGTGRNTAKIDVCKGTRGAVYDTVHDVAKTDLKKVSVKCPGLRPSSRSTLSQRAISYPKVGPTVRCGRSGGRHWIGIGDPEMRAVDVTRNVDFQTVAFAALLYKRDDGDWTLHQSTVWLWDRTYDEQIDAFPGNYWRSFKGDTRVRKFVDFEPDEPGIYEVRIRYRWHAANGLKTHALTEAAFAHSGPFQNRDQSACDFPGPPLAEGVYSGVTDEQQGVSLKVESLYEGPPKSTAWSVITSFDFTASVNCPSVATAATTWKVEATEFFYIAIHSDGTFSSSYAGPITTSRGGRVIPATATYFVSGRIDMSGNAAGTVRLSQISYDENGVHYDCTGAPHAWSAKTGP